MHEEWERTENYPMNEITDEVVQGGKRVDRSGKVPKGLERNAVEIEPSNRSECREEKRKAGMKGSVW